MGWWKLDEDHNPVYLGEGVEAVKQAGMDDMDARRVGLDHVGLYRVSTVFLALDHNYSPVGPPILFETMVFLDGSHADHACVRYETWDQAKKGHEIFVEGLQWAQEKNLMADAERFESYLEVLQTRAGNPPDSSRDSKDSPTSSDSPEETTNE